MKNSNNTKLPYIPPTLMTFQLQCEQMIADSPTLMYSRHSDTDAEKSSDGFTWGEVKSNPVDWNND